MISVKTYHQIHNNKLMEIIKAFKIRCYYLENYKHEIFVLIDPNNLSQFIVTQNLSSKPIFSAHKLSQYYLQIHYQ